MLKNILLAIIFISYTTVLIDLTLQHYYLNKNLKNLTPEERKRYLTKVTEVQHILPKIQKQKASYFIRIGKEYYFQKHHNTSTIIYRINQEYIEKIKTHILYTSLFIVFTVCSVLLYLYPYKHRLNETLKNSI